MTGCQHRLELALFCINSQVDHAVWLVHNTLCMWDARYALPDAAAHAYLCGARYCSAAWTASSQKQRSRPSRRWQAWRWSHLRCSCVDVQESE